MRRCIFVVTMSEPPNIETTAEDATRILGLLTDESVEGWVAGGWGIDALIGRQTRPHRDLDILVPLRQVLTVHRLLLFAGFVVESDWYPVRFEMIHPAGRAVDVHPLRLDADGGGRLELADGEWWEYDAEALSGRGSIGGRECLCLSASEQIRCHTGYEPTEKDARDMHLLAGHFGLQLPPPYG